MGNLRKEGENFYQAVEIYFYKSTKKLLYFPSLDVFPYKKISINGIGRKSSLNFTKATDVC